MGQFEAHLLVFLPSKITVLNPIPKLVISCVFAQFHSFFYGRRAGLRAMMLTGTEALRHRACCCLVGSDSLWTGLVSVKLNTLITIYLTVTHPQTMHICTQTNTHSSSKKPFSILQRCSCTPHLAVSSTYTTCIAPTLPRPPLAFLNQLKSHFLRHICPVLPQQPVLPPGKDAAELYYSFLVHRNCICL